MKSKCINRVELRGAVGTVRINETGEGRIVRFSLATNYVYRASDGTHQMPQVRGHQQRREDGDRNCGGQP